MKRLLPLIIGYFTTVALYAQQEPQYTQFMHNKLLTNPAYAGTKKVACFTAQYRSQWMGLEGAPKTQVLSFNGLLKNRRVGLGANFSRNAIGVSERWTFDGIYAYHIRLNKAELSFGLQASMRYLGTDYTDRRLVASTPLLADAAIELGTQRKYLPNFGVGLYLSTERFFLGASLPRLLENDLSFGAGNNSIFSSEARHSYLMGGLLFALGEDFQLSPQVLLKAVPNAPVDLELNLSMLVAEVLHLGGTYHFGGSSTSGKGEAIDLLVGAQLSKRIMFIISFDLALSQLKDYSNGGIEGLIQYCFVKPNAKEFVNPRFF